MLKRQQTILYSIVVAVGLFLHLLLWDVDFLSRVSRSFGDWGAFTNMMGVVYDWIRLYLIRGIGVWMIIVALLMLFVILPMASRYKYITIKPSPWLAISASIYFFLAMKLLNVY